MPQNEPGIDEEFMPEITIHAQSDGIVYADWYTNLSGYRNNANVYQP